MQSSAFFAGGAQPNSPSQCFAAYIFQRFLNSKVPKKLPVVLSQDEIRRLMLAMPLGFLLPSQLAYGSELRLMEVVRWWVQGIF